MNVDGEKENSETTSDQEKLSQVHDETVDDEGAGIDNSKDAPGAKVRRGSFIFSKWLLLSFFLLVSIITGLGLGLFPGIPNIRNNTGFMAVADIDNDNLSEEMISPFFIPISGESQGESVRIDLSVIWDGLASVRYRKKELRIRNTLYGYLREFANTTKDMDASIPALEYEMSRIFRESLGVADLAVKIKEVKRL